jgi:flavin-dependent dehydrogenase
MGTLNAANRAVTVAVIGGGPAGSVAAMLLARAGVTTTVLEGEPQGRWKIGEGLPPISRRMLARLGLWDRFLEDLHLPSYGNCSAWGSEQLVDHNFIFDPNGNGWHLDRSRFDKMLSDAALKAGAGLERGAKVVTCRQSDTGHWRLDARSQGGAQFHIDARFIVDATGRTSWFARRQGARRLRQDSLVSAVALLTPMAGAKQDLDSLTMVEAVEDGWWYSVLIPDGKLVVAYMSDADRCSARVAGTVEGWMELLAKTRHISRRVESHRYQVQLGPRMAPANSSRLSEPIGDSWVAVGDAALSYDPLSSFGIVGSMETASYAATAITRLLAGDRTAKGHYSQSLDTSWTQYLSNRMTYYQLERRWPDSPFWRRRSQLS